MTKTIRIDIPGRPQGKARPRFRKIGNYITTYNTKQTKTYEELVAKCALEQCKDELDKEYIGRTRVQIKAIFKPNKGISKKKEKELIEKPFLKKPDFDNIAKIICDSLNGIAYKDDNVIYEAIVTKVYGFEDKVIVLIEYCDKDEFEQNF